MNDNDFECNRVEILIVEDSPTQAEGLKFTLERHDFDVSIARNGIEALALIRTSKPTMVISDIVMPEMDGYELCREIKADEKLRDLPVILLTALSDPRDVVRGLECGADNFITKPYDERNILTRIQYILANKHLKDMENTQLGVEVILAGEKYFIKSDRIQILNLLLSSYEAAIQKNEELINAQNKLMLFNEQLEQMVESRTAALHESEKEWERTFDAISDPVMILDTDYRIIKANKAMSNKLKVTSSGIVGESCYRLVHGTGAPPSSCPNIKLLADRLPHSAEMAEARLGGSFFVAVSPLYDQEDKLSGSVHYARDITEQKKLEVQLFQAQKMEAIGQMAGGIAHDFNNILTAIVGFSTLIEMKMDKDDPQRENLNYVLAGAERAADLTRSLLAFSRKQIINPQPVDLNQIIEKIEKFLQRIIGEDINLRTSMAPEVLTVNADSGQIEQILMNLATNARDAMPKGGLLSIETGMAEMDAEYVKSHGYGEPGLYACISVSDSGEGMDEETCKKVFEPFFTTKEVGKGTGLGLSIVYGIVKQHTGFINVYSEPGKGTTFRIYLPAIQSAASEKHSGGEEVLKGGTETILLADDDAPLRELAEKVLSMFGYTVITAADGSEALALFRENKDRIHLVILDIIMPKMNGKDSFEEMKRINPAVKTIFMSGYTRDIIHNRGLLDPNFDFVSKPLNPKKLLLKVREVLGGE